MARDLVGVGHKMPAAFGALGHGQHAVVDELDQTPGAGHRQHGLQALSLGLFQVQLISLDHGLDLIDLRSLVQILMDIEEQRSVDIGLLGYEPVCRERQLAL